VHVLWLVGIEAVAEDQKDTNEKQSGCKQAGGKRLPETVALVDGLDPSSSWTGAPLE
jgi:hypothetical protein